MRTTIELPESVYQQSEKIARLKGSSVEQVIVQALERALQSEPKVPASPAAATLLLIASPHPGTPDPGYFNFDDLLA